MADTVASQLTSRKEEYLNSRDLAATGNLFGRHTEFAKTTFSSRKVAK